MRARGPSCALVFIALVGVFALGGVEAHENSKRETFENTFGLNVGSKGSASEVEDLAGGRPGVSRETFEPEVPVDKLRDVEPVAEASSYDRTSRTGHVSPRALEFEETVERYVRYGK